MVGSREGELSEDFKNVRQKGVREDSGARAFDDQWSKICEDREQKNLRVG